MKWCRIEEDNHCYFAIVEDDHAHVIAGSPCGELGSPFGDPGLRFGDAGSPVTGPFTRTGRRYPLADVKCVVPVVPRNFYAVGLNYRAHIEWAAKRHGLKVSYPTQPDVGYRSPNALVATGADIVIPADSPGPVEFEGELVAIVGREAKNLSEEEALGCIAGYTLGNDVSERGWQRSDRTLWRAKNTDTFKPMGPVVATDLDPMAQRISVRVNGRTVSEYDTSGMIFRVREYIARITRYVTLYPGDVIWFGCDGPTEPALSHGDVVEVTCPSIGVLTNRVVRAR